MLEPFPAVSEVGGSAAANLRRTGFDAQALAVDGAVVIHLRGELDLATAPRLRHVLDAALAEDATGLVLDLADLTFVDSTGIGVFVTAARRAQDLSRSFTLRHPTRAVGKALRLTGVEQQLNVRSGEHPAGRRTALT